MAPGINNLPDGVRVVEVGPRDGLQNESVVLSTDDKVAYINLLADAGFTEVEVTSFVHPQRVPQLADAKEVLSRLSPRPDLRYTALVPNLKGLQRAIESGVSSIALFTAASETFTQRNIGMSIADSLRVFGEILPLTREHNMVVRAYVSTAFVCPFEGEIKPEQVSPLVKSLMELEVDEISLGDTIGHATPGDVARLTEELAPILPLSKTAYHFHDTRGTALANVFAALQYGISTFDSASGGVGGCPFAPGAAGNLATEDLLYMLHGMGIKTGVELAKVVEASRFLASKLGRSLPGKYLQSINSCS